VSRNVSAPDHALAARWLALAVLLAGAILSAPAWPELIAAIRLEDLSSLPRWSSLLLAVALLQVAYALYWYLLPDVGSSWIVTWFCLITATAGAVLLGFAYAAPQDSPWIHRLELGEGESRSAIVGWCFLMVAFNGVLAYLGGRHSARWSRAERRIREMSHDSEESGSSK
jgi:hypothetical protein